MHLASLALALVNVAQTPAPDELVPTSVEEVPEVSLNPLRLRAPDDPFARSVGVALGYALWGGSSVGTGFRVEQSLYRHVWLTAGAWVEGGQMVEHSALTETVLGAGTKSRLFLQAGGRWVMNPGDEVELFGAAEARLSSAGDHLQANVFDPLGNGSGERTWNDMKIKALADARFGVGAEWAATERLRVRFATDLARLGVIYNNDWGGTDPNADDGSVQYQFSRLEWLAGVAVQPSLALHLRF